MLSSFNFSRFSIKILYSKQRSFFKRKKSRIWNSYFCKKNFTWNKSPEILKQKFWHLANVFDSFLPCLHAAAVLRCICFTVIIAETLLRAFLLDLVIDWLLTVTLFSLHTPCPRIHRHGIHIRSNLKDNVVLGQDRKPLLLAVFYLERKPLS